jgi:hypothetical protein
MDKMDEKIIFAGTLLGIKGITPSQRLKILGLLKAEYEVKETLKEQKSFHDPRVGLALLSEFTNDNYPVKWLVHTVDRPEYRTYNDIVDPVKNLLNYKRWVRLLDYDKDLWWDVIFPFVFQTKLTKDKDENDIPYGWGRKNIKIGWQFPDLIKVWCEKNMDNKTPDERKYPFEMSLPSNMEFPRGVRTFEDVVREFNKEIRYERNTLSLEINQLGQEVFKQHNLTNKIEGITKLYVHTWKVRKALHRIFGMIHWRTENNEVLVTNQYNEDRSMMWLKITHVDSKSPSAPNDSALSGSYGDLREIIMWLRNVCDFSIEGKFMDPKINDYKPYRISYLYPDMTFNSGDVGIAKIDSLENEQVVKGFTYVLGFYLFKS